MVKTCTGQAGLGFVQLIPDRHELLNTKFFMAGLECVFSLEWIFYKNIRSGTGVIGAIWGGGD